MRTIDTDHRRGAVMLAGILSLVLPAALAAVEGDPAVRIAADARAMLAMRDALVAELAGLLAAAGTDTHRLSLTAPEGLAAYGRRLPLTVALVHAGPRWAPGSGSTPRYNKASHLVRAEDLVLTADRLTGRLAVRILSDGWVPADKRPRDLLVTVEAQREGDALTGTFAATGDYGTYTGSLSGRLAAMAFAAPTVAPAPAADAPPAVLGAAAVLAYREARAALLCLRAFPRDFAAVLAGHRLALPGWGPGPEGLQDLADHLGALRRLLAAAVARREEAVAVERGSIDPGDPWFQPSGEPSLAVAGGVNRLPEDVGDPGSQAWRFVSRWRLLAAFPPDPCREVDTPRLPPLLPVGDACYDETPGFDPPAAAERAWVDHTAHFPPVPPPGQAYHPKTGKSHGKFDIDAGVNGRDRARWFATATVHAPRDVELWTAVLADDLGRLWHDGTLVWRSDLAHRPWALCRLRLHAGENRLLLECENRDGISTVGLAFCVRGGPLDAAARKLADARVRSATAALPPIGCRGRLGDWSSAHPDAEPPLAWDLTSGVNLRWRTPLPGYSAANPVIWGERVFVNGEPHHLYCLDKATGRIRWQRAVNVFSFAPAAEREEALAAWERGWQADETPAVAALDERIAAVARRLRGREDPALEDEQQALQEERRQILRRLQGGFRSWCERLGVTKPGWSDNYGWTMGAPVTDGAHVWVKFGTGVAACFTVDGEQVWRAHTRLSGGVANIHSPLLLEGRFIVLGRYRGRTGERPPFHVGGRPQPAWPPYFKHVLIAYDAATGTERWRLPAWVSGGYGGPSGMSPLRLANGTCSRELILLGSGLVVDPKDGRVLTHPRGPGPSNYAGDPMVFGNRAAFRSRGRAQIVEYLLEDDGAVRARTLLETEPGAYGQPGIVYLGGRLFGNQNKSPGGGQPVPWHQVGCVDVATGKRVVDIWPALHNGGLGYTPAAAAGDYAVVSATNSSPHAWGIGRKDSAEIGFVRNAAVPYVAATCQVQGEPMVAAPVFEGRAMYLRTYRSALCIAVESETGQDLVDATLARHLLAQVPERPAGREVVAVPVPPASAAAAGVGVEAVGERTAPQDWLVAGPLPLDDADPLAALGGTAAARLVPGRELVHGDTTFAFRRVDPAHLDRFKGQQLDLYDIPHFVARCRIDLTGVAGGRTGVRYLYHALIRSEAASYQEVHTSMGQGQTLWIGGVRVEDGMVLALPPGLHPVLLQVDLQQLPPHLASLKRVAGFSLRQIEPPDRALAAWYDRLEALRPRLEQMLEDMPRSRHRVAILRYLEVLDRRGRPAAAGDDR